MRFSIFVLTFWCISTLIYTLVVQGTEEKDMTITHSGGSELPEKVSPKDTDDTTTYKNLFSFDDTSIYRFVSKDRPLTTRDYVPMGLVSISGAHISTAGRKDILLREEARDALWTLANDFSYQFSLPLTVISGYRSAKYQQWMWDLGKCSDTLCAPPGYSEHQLGLAIDIFDASTASEYTKNPHYRKYIAWMQKYAHRYGWHQSYQKGASIDRYEVEPWHWRYLGVDMATRLYNLGWTYTEYIEFQELLQRHALWKSRKMNTP